MSLPRRLVPGQTHTVTRRTARRAALLRPSPKVNQILLYCLGVAQHNNPGATLFTLVAMANHLHLTVVDEPAEAGEAGPDAPPERSALPGFFRDLHSLAARGLNAHYGRAESLWSNPGSYDNVEVHQREALERQIVYQMANPVQAGLVERPGDWPGVSFLPEDFGTSIVVERPDESFFGGRRPQGWLPTYGPARRAVVRQRRRAAEERARQERARDLARGRSLRRHRQLAVERERRRQRDAKPRYRRRSRARLPDRVTVTIARPPGYDGWTLDEVRAHYRRLLDQRVAEIHAERRAQGKTDFAGAAAILALNPRDSLARDTFPTFATNPRLCGSGPIFRALRRGLRAWRARYRAAYLAWRAGARGVVFPLGSYGVPRFHGALVERATGPPRLH